MRETASLKSLASNVLTKAQRNTFETRELRTNFRSSLKSLSFDSISSLSKDYEERLAIAEYDGHQSPAQAQRIAYQDAFIAVLTSFPDEASSAETSPKKWLSHRIQSAQDQLKDMERSLPGGNA